MHDREWLERALARTYTPQPDGDPWEDVLGYRRATEFQADNPDFGSKAVASVVDITNSKAQAWLDRDGTPEPLHGIETAYDRGWLPLDLESPTGRGLNGLLAWAASGGNVASAHYVPQWHVGIEQDDTWFRKAADMAGVELVDTGNAEHEGDEYRPDADTGVLGRLFAVLGLHVGRKTTDAPRSVPWYLAGAPPAVRRDFVQIYIANREYDRSGRNTLEVREHRHEAYFESLADLFEKVLGEDVNAGSQYVTLSHEAVKAFEALPAPLADVEE